MQALMARVAAETVSQPDPTLLPALEGRDQTARNNQRWNVNLPPMADDREIQIEGDSALGSQSTRLRILVPNGAEGGTIFFVHGGGFAFCSPETHERCARVLADEARMTVVMPDYRLAPENPYPAGLLDTIACLRAVIDGRVEGIDCRPLFVSGDSAGANLALAAILHEIQSGFPLPDGGLLFYGNYACDLSGESYRTFENGPGLTTARMCRYWDWYAGNRAIEADPLACPLTASDAALSQLPPLYLMAAGVDPLFSDTIGLHARLRALGRHDDLAIVPGVTHGFLQNTNELEAAREALRHVGTTARMMKTTP
jgi:acetyl esterase